MSKAVAWKGIIDVSGPMHAEWGRLTKEWIRIMALSCNNEHSEEVFLRTHLLGVGSLLKTSPFLWWFCRSRKVFNCNSTPQQTQQLQAGITSYKPSNWSFKLKEGFVFKYIRDIKGSSKKISFSPYFLFKQHLAGDYKNDPWINSSKSTHPHHPLPNTSPRLSDTSSVEASDAILERLAVDFTYLPT